MREPTCLRYQDAHGARLARRCDLHRHRREHACILRRDGRISYWGDNSPHQVSSNGEPIWSQEQSSHNCYPVHWGEPKAVGVSDVFWGPP